MHYYKPLLCCAMSIYSSAIYMPVEDIDTVAAEYKCMLDNVWHEARGESISGMRAVALVVMNRAKRQHISLCETIYKAGQFSWTNKQLTSSVQYNMSNVSKAVNDVMYGVKDITHGSTHYHAQYIKPSWSNEMKISAVIGSHIFYK